MLDELAGLVTPETILRWYRELVAKKYDGTAGRGAGRPLASSPTRRQSTRADAGEARSTRLVDGNTVRLTYVHRGDARRAARA